MNVRKAPQNFISQLILSCWMKLIIGATAFIITYTTTKSDCLRFSHFLDAKLLLKQTQRNPLSY